MITQTETQTQTLQPHHEAVFPNLTLVVKGQDKAYIPLPDTIEIVRIPESCPGLLWILL